MTVASPHGFDVAAGGQGERAMSERPSGDRTVPMDTFKWIVSGLLGTLVLAAGWLLGDIRSDLRDMRKDVTAIRIEAAATNTRLQALTGEPRQPATR
jgi:hypothetical protein